MRIPGDVRVLIVLAALVPAAGTLAAQGGTPTVPAATIVRQGNGHGAPACVACHGPALQGMAAMLSPRLAGQGAAYVVAQLDAFASGTRQNATMKPVASALSPAEREALGAYLAGLAPVAQAESAAAPASSAVLKLGERLATQGDWSAGLPSCDRCHGPGGVGVGDAFPPLAGQTAAYLASQFDAWKRNTRPPGPLGLMAAIASRMTDADVAAVAAYYATLSPTPPVVRAGRATP
jgi:cytochrome c553